MPENIGELLIKLSADIKDLKAGLQSGRSELSSFKSQAESLGASVKKVLAFAGIATGIWEIAGALKTFATNAAMTGARVETLGIGMNLIGKNVGMSADSLALLTRQLKAAGITTEESMKAINTAMVSGIDLTQLQALATRARDVAAVAGKNTSETLQTIMHALVSRQMEMIRNLNVPMQNYEDVVKRISARLGVDKDQIDRVTMVNELMKAFMDSSKGLEGAAAAMDKAVGKQMTSLDRLKKEAQESLWTFFQPIMESGVQALASWWRGLAQFAADNKQSLKELGAVIGEELRRRLENLATVLKLVADNANLLGLAFKAWATYALLGWVGKLAGLLAGVGTAATAAMPGVTGLTAALAALKAILSGPWALVITISVLGLAAAYAAINEVKNAAQIKALRTGEIDTRTKGEGPVGSVPLEGRQLTEQEWKNIEEAARQTEAQKKLKKLVGAPFSGEKRLSGLPSLAGKNPEEQIKELSRVYGVSEDEIRQRQEQTAKAEAEDYLQNQKKKAQADITPKPDKGGGGQGKIEDFTRLIERELKAQLDLEIAKSEQSLHTLKSEQDKRKAVLQQEAEEGKITKEEYYQELEKMDKEYYAKAQALIQQKIEAENKLFPQQIETLKKSEKLSPEALQSEIKRMTLEHQKRLIELGGEMDRSKIEQAREEANLTKETYQYRKEIRDLMAEGQEALALGPVAEKEAEINRLLRERQELRKKVPAEQQTAFDEQTAGMVWMKQEGEDIKNWGNTVSSGIKNFITSITDGSQNIKTAMNNFFKNLFSQSLETGFKQLTQWIMTSLKEMFGTLGSGVASAVMGVIGLIGMMLTSGGGSSSWSPAGNVQSGVTSTQAVRGVIAGETSIPIAEISVSLQDALVTTNGILREIANNTRGGGSGQNIRINMSGMQDSIREAIERYFREYLLTGAGA